MSGNTQKSLRVNVMRSQLGRARGLGAAHSGVHHWWLERVTSIALIPLTIWFVVAVLTKLGVQRRTEAVIEAAKLGLISI